MKKKLIVMGITFIFIMISGICYSCAFQKAGTPVLVSSLSLEGDAGGKEILGGQNSLEGQNFLEGQENQKEQAALGKETTISESSAKETAEIYVHICGAVEAPGVYRVDAGTRLVDVITLAGGLCMDAAEDYTNQAVTVEDGERIYIPTLDEVKDLTTEQYLAGNQGKSQEQEQEDNSLINLNTAGMQELMSLPGIGQAKAKSIIDYRTTKGEFQSAEDLMNIPGIKEGLFHQIADKIIVK